MLWFTDWNCLDQKPSFNDTKVGRWLFTSLKKISNTRLAAIIAQTCFSYDIRGYNIISPNFFQFSTSKFLIFYDTGAKLGYEVNLREEPVLYYRSFQCLCWKDVLILSPFLFDPFCFTFIAWRATVIAWFQGRDQTIPFQFWSGKTKSDCRLDQGKNKMSKKNPCTMARTFNAAFYFVT